MGGGRDQETDWSENMNRFKVYKLRPDRRYMGEAKDGIDALLLMDDALEDERAIAAECWDAKTDSPIYAIHTPRTKTGRRGKRRYEGTRPTDYEKQQLASKSTGSSWPTA